jgi:hypothetical protein
MATIPTSAHEDPSAPSATVYTQPLHSEALMGAVEANYVKSLKGCESSIYNDSSEEYEGGGNVEGGDVEELLGWPPEMLLIPTERRVQRRVVAQTEVQHCVDSIDETQTEWGGEGSVGGPRVGENKLGRGLGWARHLVDRARYGGIRGPGLTADEEGWGWPGVRGTGRVG